MSRSLAARLALAIEYFHSAGIVQGYPRDSNVLIQAPPGFEHEKLGAPLTKEITRFYDVDIEAPLCKSSGPCHHTINMDW